VLFRSMSYAAQNSDGLGPQDTITLLPGTRYHHREIPGTGCL